MFFQLGARRKDLTGDPHAGQRVWMSFTQLPRHPFVLGSGSQCGIPHPPRPQESDAQEPSVQASEQKSLHSYLNYCLRTAW